MIPAEIIRRKRDGYELTQGQIQFFVDAFASGQIPDYQMSAFAMSVYFQGMTNRETTILTRCMMETGSRFSWSKDKPIVDKHSTGGIGDKVSIVLAPLLASCGLQVPMISGRGLGPTGGTLDKLEAIPGFRTNLTMPNVASTVESVGCVITGATADICPGDRKLYALRDVTATIESIPLITASIMSKKLAESLDALVLDVKFGSGSFMQTIDEATRLARSLVRVGGELGLPTTALLTDMNQPLGRMVGNAVEVAESIDCLQGHGPADLRQIVISLGVPLLVRSLNIADDIAASNLAQNLDNGIAYETFRKMVAAQSGDLAALVKPSSQSTVCASDSGIVQSIDGRKLGNVIIELGGGRKKATDHIDHSVGVEMLVRIGDEIIRNQPIAHVFAKQTDARRVSQDMQLAVLMGETKVQPPPLIAKTIDSTEDLTSDSRPD